MKKTTTFIIVLMAAVIILDVGYSSWKNQVLPGNTIRFIDPIECSDNEDSTNVAECIVKYEKSHPKEGWNQTTITLENAYPGYEAYSKLTLKNIGDSVDTITEITITDPTGYTKWRWTTPLTEGQFWRDGNGNNSYDPGEEHLEITLTGLNALSLKPEEITSAYLNISIDGGAEENRQYSLVVNIPYESS